METPAKAHRAPRAGLKAEKKDQRKKHDKGYNEKVGSVMEL
jgi:hypothetical protein